MAVNYKFELVGVLGFPVAENPTCVMQEAAFAELGLLWRYLTIEVKPDGLPDAIRGARAMGMKGVNLTIPHKVAVLAIVAGRNLARCRGHRGRHIRCGATVSSNT